MRSRLAAVVVFTASVGVGASPAQSGADAQSSPPQVYRPGSDGVTFPALLRQEQPRYREAAMRAKIEGVVELEAVVLANGTVGDVRVVKSLDTVFGLDAEAIATAKRWLFRPGTLNGRPVAVMVTLILEFRLHNGPRPPTPSRPEAAPSTPDAQIQRQDDEFLKDTYSSLTPGLVQPTLKTQVHPKYTAGAMRAKIQGVVTVEAVVLADGSVGRSRVTTSLDKSLGLDDEALRAVNQWTFEPGQLNGQVVPVAISLTLEFRLH